MKTWIKAGFGIYIGWQIARTVDGVLCAFLKKPIRNLIKKLDDEAKQFMAKEAEKHD